MKSKYDFSKAERGKFFKPDATLQLPVYLDPDVSKFINKLAAEKKTDSQRLVNDWLRANMTILVTPQK